jgi:hypothetical protein
MGDDLLTVAQVRRLLGDRFGRVCGNGACCPLDVNGRVMYHRPLVEQGLRKDLARYPEGRRPAVVTKGYAAAGRGGVPEVVIGRDGVHRVVVKAAPAAAGWAAQVRAEVEDLLAAARRMLAGWR